MSNHFHVLLDVPDPEGVPQLTEEILLEKLALLYPKSAVLTVKQELERAKDHPNWRQEILDRYQSRMGRLDLFMKELKQRFTQWYNRNNHRKGTLWEDRYKSVLVEGNENALITMSAFIDFNCPSLRSRPASFTEFLRVLALDRGNCFGGLVCVIRLARVSI